MNTLLFGIILLGVSPMPMMSGKKSNKERQHYLCFEEENGWSQNHQINLIIYNNKCLCGSFYHRVQNTAGFFETRLKVIKWSCLNSSGEKISGEEAVGFPDGTK